MLLVLGEERRNLQYALLYNLLNRHVELVVRHLQHVVEYMVHALVAVDDLQILCAHNHRRHAETVAEVDYRLSFMGWNEVLAHYLFAIYTLSTGGKNKTVHDVLYLRDVVEQLAWATRSGEELHAALVCLAKCFNCRFRHLVCIKADERSVYVEKQGFYHIL